MSPYEPTIAFFVIQYVILALSLLSVTWNALLIRALKRSVSLIEINILKLLVGLCISNCTVGIVLCLKAVLTLTTDWLFNNTMIRCLIIDSPLYVCIQTNFLFYIALCAERAIALRKMRVDAARPLWINLAVAFCIIVPVVFTVRRPIAEWDMFLEKKQHYCTPDLGDTANNMMGVVIVLSYFAIEVCVGAVFLYMRHVTYSRLRAFKLGQIDMNMDQRIFLERNKQLTAMLFNSVPVFVCGYLPAIMFSGLGMTGSDSTLWSQMSYGLAIALYSSILPLVFTTIERDAQDRTTQILALAWDRHHHASAREEKRDEQSGDAGCGVL